MVFLNLLYQAIQIKKQRLTFDIARRGGQARIESQETRLVVGRVSSDSQIPTSTFDISLDSVLRISNFVFPPRTWYNTLELHLQSHQEIRPGLRIKEVLRHQFTARSSRYKVAEGVAVWLIQLIEDIIDQ